MMVLSLTEIVLADLDYLTGKDVEQQCQSGALFLVKMKEQRRTSQVLTTRLNAEGCLCNLSVGHVLVCEPSLLQQG